MAEDKKEGLKKSNLKARVLSGLIMAPLLVVVLIDGYVLAVATFIIAMLGLREFYTAVEKAPALDKKVRPSFGIGYVCVFLLYLSSLIGHFSISVNRFTGESTYETEITLSGMTVIWLIFAVLLCLLMLLDSKRSLGDALATIAGVMYIGFLLYHMVSISGIMSWDPVVIWQARSNYAWFVIFTAFGSDIFAYFAGTLFGKHKIAPKISPKKSVEGFIGGIFGSTLLCGLYGWFYMPDFFVHSLIIGVLGSIFALLGDLCASAIKRRLGIKDFGKLIPGHGGILDRIDSILFTAPFVNYYVTIAMLISFKGTLYFQM